ncbi:MAG: DNA polymerase subunit beta, partial [Archaeoglobi archaeon]|nr:DNA polymerase subunit beta [Candidatus Mnemosynella sp.]
MKFLRKDREYFDNFMEYAERIKEIAERILGEAEVLVFGSVAD